MCRSRTQRGLSLVELMVGMLLGILLIGGAASIYLASSRSYREVEQVSALAENARFAEQIVTDSLRHVGFFGEVLPNKVERDSSLTDPTGDCSGRAAAYDVDNYLFATKVSGTVASEYVGGTAISCITDGVAGTEVLVIKSAIPQPYTDGPRVPPYDPNDPTEGDGTIDFPPSPYDKAEKTYVMTNNVLGIVFDGADTPPTITTGGRVPGGVAWEYRYEIFYVRRLSKDLSTLSRKTLEMNGGAMQITTENLVEGVEDMRLRFGFDSTNDGEVDSYANPATVTDWGRVQSVEVTMLIRSATEDKLYTDGKTYTLAGNERKPTDLAQNYRRLISFASISLRNPKFMIRGDAG